MFQYEQQQRYFAQVAPGIEPWAVDELTSLGATDVQPAFRGVHFQADYAVCGRILYTARLITRVLAPLITFDCHSDRYLYRTAMKLDWERIMGPDHTLAVTASTSNTPGLKHSRYAALKLKDAVCDYFRARGGRRPSVDTVSPDVGLHLFVRNNRATISLDASGGSLHKRGYRVHTVDAPLQETLAAAIIRITGWDGQIPLVDPMCGSGTLLCEAAMRVANIPAGYLRSPPVWTHLPGFEQANWDTLKADADRKIGRVPPGCISGSDCSAAAVSAARVHCARLPGPPPIAIQKQDFQEIPCIEKACIVTNPPYGVRMGDRAAAEQLIKTFGDFLKQRCTGCVAYVYAGDRPLLKKLGLKPKATHELSNGGLAGVLGQYELY